MLPDSINQKLPSWSPNSPGEVIIRWVGFASRLIVNFKEYMTPLTIKGSNFIPECNCHIDISVVDLGRIARKHGSIRIGLIPTARPTDYMVGDNDIEPIFLGQINHPVNIAGKILLISHQKIVPGVKR